LVQGVQGGLQLLLELPLLLEMLDLQAVTPLSGRT
jgi:hypothetical protein